MTRAMSLAEMVTIAFMQFSTVMVDPALRPSLVGDAEAAYFETENLVFKVMLPAASSWNST